MQHPIYPTQTTPIVHLPLITLCEQLHAAQATLSFTTIIPPSAPVAMLSEGQDIVAELSFVQGRITHCQLALRMSGRVVLQQGEALQVLHTLGILSWQVHPQQHHAEAETMPISVISTDNGTDIPTRVPLPVVPVDQVPLTSLPVRVRHVFLLSNGQRTLEDIAQLLRLPLAEVERVIQFLQRRRLTTWQSRAS